MGEIRKDNLHESLIEELNELANIDLSGKQDKTDESLLTESKDLVGAINELFQSANNGKELIANAIGEPLNSSDTFSAMSGEINNLNSQFKSALMNNGVSVESTDKFKQLIDKLALLADNEGKGILYAEAHLKDTISVTSNMKTLTYLYNDLNINFEPTFLIVGNKDSGPLLVNEGSLDYGIGVYRVEYIDGGFTFKCWSSSSSSSTTVNNINCYAIGVGEEDTTLRDSLASILTEEGVSVTEEDDMASLISKVDEEFDRKNEEMENNKGLDIISATELPATGKENQICVITDNPVNDFVITSNYSDINTNNTIYIFLGNSLDTTGIKGTNFDLVSNNITMKYYLLSVHQGGNKLDSYIYKNNQWTNATMSSFYIVEKGNSVNESYTGGFKGDWTVSNLNGTPCYVINIPNNVSAGGGTMCFDNCTVNKINVSDYTTLEYTIASTMPGYSFAGEVYMLLSTTRNITMYIEEIYKYWKTSQPGSFTTYTIDISDITGEFYLGIAYIGRGYGQKLCVSDIRLY